MRLAAFEIETPIASGGMGEVWSGRHRATGVPVAIKLLTGRLAREPRLVQSFRDEVRAMAALDHPGIVVVHDYGQIPKETEAESEGKLLADSPYLVMELVRGGPKPPGSVRSWRELREVLSALLRALAHAHARGVVHRDLKPANVLWSASGVKLTDFGIAHALRGATEPGDPEGFVGTPAYMAPEQCWGDWRDLGPWSDLYALGCLAYALATGGPPFDASSPFDLLDQHLRAAPPPFEPPFEVPPGFDVWLDRLLRKKPYERYQRAADAAWALGRLADVDAEPSEPQLRGQPEPDTIHATIDLAPRREEGPPPVVEGGAGALPESVRPPPPADWRLAREAPHALNRMSLGLYGLRTLPVVGRESEREQLWRALCAVHADRKGRVAVVRGAAGVGKSKLADWLCERSHELGAATPLRVVHDRAGGAADGIAGTLLRHFRATGMRRAELRTRLRRILEREAEIDPEEPEALSGLLAPATPEERASGERVVRFSNPAEWHLLVARHLARLGRERPLLVAVDDAQWGLETLLCMRQLLEWDAAPMLVVVVVRDDALAEREAEARALESICATPGALQLDIQPLPSVDHARLVRTLLDMDDDLARRVERRTAGNPLYAVQLVRSWVQNGLLVPGANGFRLATGATIDLPTDLHDVWSARIVRLLAERSADDELAVELAAALGVDIDHDEWLATCAAAGVRPSPSLHDELFRARIVRRNAGGSWVFGHAMLRESLERHARDAGRYAAHHRACARMLSRRGSAPERRGRHLLAAGDWQVALEAFAEGARAHLEGGDFALAEQALGEWRRALGHRKVDARIAEGLLLQAWLYSERGELDEARTLADEAIHHARMHADPEIEGRGLMRLGRIDFEAGRMSTGREALAHARRVLAPVGRPDLMGECLRRTGHVLTAVGEHLQADDTYQAAIRAYEEAGDADAAAYVLLDRAMLAKQVGRLEHAAGLIRRARGALKNASRLERANLVHDLGEVERLRGRLDEATRCYRESLVAYDAIGSMYGTYARMNLGLTLQGRGEYEAAANLLRQALPEVERQGRKVLLAACHVFLLPCCATADDWDGWDRHAELGFGLLEEVQVFEVDFARCAQLAAELATAAGRKRRARRAWQVALAQWQGLRQDEHAAAAAAGLRALA